MWIRRHLDIGWTDIAWASRHSLLPAAADANARRRLESAWAGTSEAIACLSVRTGLDLLLRALALPPGSEVLMSALNVPGMFRVVEAQGLVPVPLDLGPNLAPCAATVRNATTAKSRAVVVAHLFGARADLRPIRAFAQERGLFVIEDRAQAFDGLPAGVPDDCDAALYSFGTIKTATAFGGAMLTVRDQALAERVRSLESTLSPQRRWTYLARLLKFAAAKMLTGQRAYAALLKALAIAGRDADAWIQTTTAGFPTNGLLAQIRHRPSTPNLALMERRIARFDHARANRQRQRGICLTAFLGPDFPVAGDPTTHTFDLFPLRLGNPETVQAALRKAGFDAAMRGSMTTAPSLMQNPPATTNAKHLLDEILFLPLYPAIPDEELHRMASVVRECAEPPLGTTPLQ